jgi:hypothetical protein
MVDLAKDEMIWPPEGRCTPEAVGARVEEIRQRAEQFQHDGGPHAMEDTLYRDVLRAIAEGRCDEPAACALEALRADGLDFPRWFE